MKTTTECSYLEQPIPFFYLYHSMSEGRAIYVIYFSASGTIYVVVVNPVQNKQQNKELSSSMLEKQYREACQALSVEPLVPGRATVFKVEFVGYAKDAEKLVQKMINEYRNQHHGPAIGMIECPNFHLLKSGIRVLNDFPCVSIPCNTRDSHYQAVGWQPVVAKIGVQRCAASSQWLNERISLSRYAHVPLGNFELDWLLFTADIFFSRALRDHHQVLWISDDGIPDIGCISEEDACFADEVHQPVLNYPAAYRKVTVELKIHHLAVDALLKSNQVNEMEGGALFGFGQDLNSGSHDLAGFDEAHSCASAFRVLKQLIQRCLQDAIKYGNVFADAILQHLYRWLCSPKSKLHDPTLHRVLHKVMQKVFALLLAEIRRLGATIVYADFSKIIIDTGKLDLSAAQAYCDCLLKTLQSRDLFEWIELEPLHFWDSLLFMDQYNYGGIQAKSNGELQVDGKAQVGIVSSWNIAEYLPKVTQDHFVLVVSEFLLMPWQYAQKLAREQAEHRLLATDGNLCTPSVTAGAAESFESLVTENLKKQISSHFTEKLLKIVRDTIHHEKGMSRLDTDDHVSQATHSNAHKGDTALEFIKHVCAVLALDHNVQHDVLVMRKNLLKLVRVREFDPEAEFSDSCFSFSLPNVICSYCNDCRDLDLCRDSTLLAQEWRCAVPQCGHPYDREVMENALIQIVRQRERLYHLQDLVCFKCNQVKGSHLAEQCTCGGSFRCKEDINTFQRKMQAFLNIAALQNFQLLQECVSWILEVH